MKHQRYMLKLLIYVLLGAAVTSAFPIPPSRPSGEIDHTSSLESEKETPRKIENGDIISVRITSSVAVERGKKERERSEQSYSKMDLLPASSTRLVTAATERARFTTNTGAYRVSASERRSVTALPPSLAGANIEYIKQLRSKKEGKSLHVEHPFRLALEKQNETPADSVAEASQIDIHEDVGENAVPRARSIPLSSFANSFHVSNSKVNVTRDHKRDSTTTSVSIGVVHELPSHPIVYSEPAKVYGEPSKVYGEPAKVYGEPERFYSEPAKVYGEPAKVYSEPAKVYGEPSKVYGEPAKVYGEPSKFYSEPASLHLDKIEPNQDWAVKQEASTTTEQTLSSTKSPRPSELNQAIDDGRSQEPEPDKVGYVMEGSDYRRYRVEERTADGFIVGEYGVVSNTDGSLRGVRYTAAGDASPRLIYEALLKFLHLT